MATRATKTLTVLALLSSACSSDAVHSAADIGPFQLAVLDPDTPAQSWVVRVCVDLPPPPDAEVTLSVDAWGRTDDHGPGDAQLVIILEHEELAVIEVEHIDHRTMGLLHVEFDESQLPALCEEGVRATFELLDLGRSSPAEITWWSHATIASREQDFESGAISLEVDELP